MFTSTLITISTLLVFLIGSTLGKYEITLLKYPDIADCGYPYEVHDVVTSDGYILTVLRVTTSNSKTNSTNKPAVIFVPGLTCSASVWVNYGPEKSLPCILSEKGYDSWLVNYRGTTWSRKHAWLNPDVDKKQYWNFTLHEISTYDIPAVIDYVLNKTNQKTVYYVGHSQGNPIFLMMAASRKEYAEKIKLMVGMAPSVFVGNTITPVPYLLREAKSFLKKVTKYFDVYEMASDSPGLVKIFQMFCSEVSPLQPICIFAFLTVLGNTPHQVNRTLLPLLITSFPAGASVDSINHSMQPEGNTLDRYDYGKRENLIRYGQEIPPEYDLTKITTPVALYYSDSDNFVPYENIDILSRKLPNLVLSKMMKGFNHMDFLFGNEAVPSLYTHVLKLMKNYK